MGYSSPKTPFNLAEFLSQKAPRNRTRRPNAWIRTSPATPPVDDRPEAEAPVADIRSAPAK